MTRRSGDLCSDQAGYVNGNWIDVDGARYRSGC
jgi:hypothetical protein